MPADFCQNRTHLITLYAYLFNFIMPYLPTFALNVCNVNSITQHIFIYCRRLGLQGTSIVVLKSQPLFMRASGCEINNHLPKKVEGVVATNFSIET